VRPVVDDDDLIVLDQVGLTDGVEQTLQVCRSISSADDQRQMFVFVHQGDTVLGALKRAAVYWRIVRKVCNIG